MNKVLEVGEDLRKYLKGSRKERVRVEKREARKPEYAHEALERAWVRQGRLKERRVAEAARPESRRVREERALARLEEPDVAFEGSAGEGVRPRRVKAWSAGLGRFVAWSFDAAREQWVPAGVDNAAALKLRVELRKAHGGASVEHVLAGLEREVA